MSSNIFSPSEYPSTGQLRMTGRPFSFSLAGISFGAFYVPNSGSNVIFSISSSIRGIRSLSSQFDSSRHGFVLASISFVLNVQVLLAASPSVLMKGITMKSQPTSSNECLLNLSLGLMASYEWRIYSFICLYRDTSISLAL